MKKVLLLGGARSQLPAIAAAKKMGYYTVLCDYLPDNPGRLLADEWYPASTTDYAAVLKVAEKCAVDGILTYGCDVAAPTVAYVAEKCGLPGSPYQSVYTLTHKDAFRQFLAQNGFHVPHCAGFSDAQRAQAIAFADEIGFPVVVKPADSQGAKGIGLVSAREQLAPAMDAALAKSICKRFIIEEYIERSGMQIGGDGFSYNGKLMIAPFSNTYFVSEPGMQFIPMAECWPPITPSERLSMLHSELQRALTLLKMGTQAYNFEAFFDKAGKLYIMEIGPRNGGSLVPLMTEKMTGFKMTEAIIQAAVGEEIPSFAQLPIDGYWASRSIGTAESGTLQAIEIDPAFRQSHLKIWEQYVDIGDTVCGMQSLSSSIAFVGARFDTEDEMMTFVQHPERYIRPVISK